MPNDITIPIPSFKMVLKGDWRKAKQYPSLIKQCMKKGYEEGTRVWAYDYLRFLLRFIGTQKMPNSINWPVTNYEYRMYGKGPRVQIKSKMWFFRTGTLRRSFGVRKTGKGLVVVGLTNGRSSASAGGISLSRALQILQNGSTHSAWNGTIVHIPPRPLLEPVMEDFGGKSKIRNIIIREIRKQLFMMGVISRR